MSHSLSFPHHGRVAIAVLLFLIFFFASCPASGQGRVYWTEPATTTIRSIDALGHDPSLVANGFQIMNVVEIDRDDAGWLYWSDAGTGAIAKSHADGADAQFIIGKPWVIGQPNESISARGIAVDRQSGLIYWAEDGLVRRARLDGSEILDLIATSGRADGVEVFPAEDLLFWTAGGATFRATLDGSDIQQVADVGSENLALSAQTRTLYTSDGAQIVAFGLTGENKTIVVNQDTNIDAIAVEDGADRLCWSVRGLDGIMCAKLDGSAGTLLTTTPDRVVGMTIDPKTRLLTFVAGDLGGRLMRCLHDGSGIEMLIDPVVMPVDVAVDPVEGKVYWADYWFRYHNIIWRSNLDGSAIESIPLTAQETFFWPDITSIAIDPVARLVYLGFSGSGLGVAGGIVSGPIGGRIDQVVVGGIPWGSITDVEVDPIGGDVYYSDGHGISKVKPDGTDRISLPAGGRLFTLGIADGTSSDENRLFWISSAGIMSSKLDGSDANLILPGIDDVVGISADGISRRIFWSEGSEGTIKRARFDGSEINTIATSGTRISGMKAVSNPSEVSLEWPPPLASDLPTSLALRWAAPPISGRSEVQVAAATGASAIVFALNTPNNEAWFDAPEAMQSYLWRARFVSAGGVGPWTEWSRFTVGSSGDLAVTITDPVDGAEDIPIEVTLNWEAAPSAVSYRVQLSDSTSFDSTFVDVAGIEETSLAIGPLNFESKYFWRVAGVGPDGKSTFSSPYSFTTIVAAPQAAMLLSPADGEEGVPVYATFTWREQEDVQSYTLEVALDSLFSQVAVSLTVGDATYAVDVPFDYDTSLYWRVRATNEGGDGPWSATWGFRTATGTGVAGADEIPLRSALNQNYPNPFNRSTILVFDLAEPSHARIEVFNALGRRVATLIDEVVPAGRHRVVFNASDMPSGRYLVRMRAGSFEQSRLTTLTR